MRLALVSDLHGNLPALEAILDDLERAGVDRVVNLGDIVSGPLWPAETVDRLQPLGWPTIRGNHERQALDAQPGRHGLADAFAARALGPAQRAWLAALPDTLRLMDDVLCVHGTPGDDLRMLLETADPAVRPGGVRPATAAEVARRLGNAMQGVPHGLIVCGHTHVPRALQLDDGRLVVNPGSAGQPAYEADDSPKPHRVEMGTPHARYAIVERRAAGWQVEFRALVYDHEAAARRALANGRPDWADLLRTGRIGRVEADCPPLPDVEKTAPGAGLAA
ncbi:MAG: metallophosphatase family protein [Ideonella sp.]|nr:metallophosphatase family protein [Ideonella sp.]